MKFWLLLLCLFAQNTVTGTESAAQSSNDSSYFKQDKKVDNLKTEWSTGSSDNSNADTSTSDTLKNKEAEARALLDKLDPLEKDSSKNDLNDELKSLKKSQEKYSAKDNYPTTSEFTIAEYSSPHDENVVLGEKLWKQHCIRCHNLRSPEEFDPDEWRAIMAHMKVRACLPDDLARIILEYLIYVSTPPKAEPAPAPTAYETTIEVTSNKETDTKEDGKKVEENKEEESTEPNNKDEKLVIEKKTEGSEEVKIENNGTEKKEEVKSESRILEKTEHGKKEKIEENKVEVKKQKKDEAVTIDTPTVKVKIDNTNQQNIKGSEDIQNIKNDGKQKQETEKESEKKSWWKVF